MADHVEAMLASHPRPLDINRTMLREALVALQDCELACTSCADACLGEKEVQSLVRCIRTNLDCADICAVTARTLARQTEPSLALVRRQLEACEAACRACEAECEQHAHHHEHCRVCAEACRRCAEACHAVLPEVPADAKQAL